MNTTLQPSQTIVGDGKIFTSTGKTYDVINPQVEMVDINDIAHHLSMESRWGGATCRFHSVAEHCIIGSYLVKPENALPFLMHDAHEAYLRDLHKPLKNLIPYYCDLCVKNQNIINRVFNVETDIEEIHEIDCFMAIIEHNQLINQPKIKMNVKQMEICHRLLFETPSIHDRMGTWTPQQAKEKFLQRFKQLTNGR